MVGNWKTNKRGDHFQPRSKIHARVNSMAEDAARQRLSDSGNNTKNMQDVQKAISKGIRVTGSESVSPFQPGAIIVPAPDGWTLTWQNPEGMTIISKDPINVSRKWHHGRSKTHNIKIWEYQGKYEVSMERRVRNPTPNREEGSHFHITTHREKYDNEQDAIKAALAMTKQTDESDRIASKDLNASYLA